MTKKIRLRLPGGSRGTALALVAIAALWAGAVESAGANPSVAAAVSPENSYPERFRAARAIPGTLSKADIEELLLLLNRLPAEDGLRPATLGSIKTEAANALVRQEVFPAGLGAKLAAAWQNERMDRLWRDYALQFLPACYDKSPDPEERDGILRTLESATESRRATFAGTALLSLGRLAGETDAVDPAELAARAAEIAADETYSQASRLTAFSVAARFDDPSILETARTTALNESTPPTLRMSAIAVIGRLGDASDVGWIEDLFRTGDTRVRLSTRHALDKLASDR